MTNKEKRALANSVIGIVDFAQQHNFDLKSTGNGVYQIMGEYKTKNHYLFDGNVGGRKDGFYQHNNTGSQSSGNVLAFAIQYLGLELKQAVDEVLRFGGHMQALEGDKPFIPKQTFIKQNVPKQSFNKISKEMVLPQKNETAREVFNYLIKDRCLDEQIVQKLIDKNYIMQFDKPTRNKDVVFSNCAFVSYDFDDTKKAMGCTLRSTPLANPPEWLKEQNVFKGDLEGSNKDFGFRLQGKSNEKLFVFESPIDAISHVTLCKIKNEPYANDTRLSLGGNNDKALTKFLEKNKDVKEIIFCLDNDKDKLINVGQQQADSYCQKYHNLGFETSKIIPNGKDFNEDLQKVVNQPKDIVNVVVEGNGRAVKYASDELQKVVEKYDLKPASSLLEKEQPKISIADRLTKVNAIIKEREENKNSGTKDIEPLNKPKGKSDER